MSKMIGLSIGALIIAIVALVLGIVSFVQASQSKQRGPRGRAGVAGATGANGQGGGTGGTTGGSAGTGATGPTGPAGGGGGGATGTGILSKTINVTNAQLLDLNGNPITLLPALPNGSTYLILGASIDAQLNQQLSNGSDFELWYNSGTASFVTFVGSKTFMTSSTTHMIGTFSATQMTISGNPDDNSSPVVLTVGTDFSDSISDSMVFTVQYAVVPN